MSTPSAHAFRQDANVIGLVAVAHGTSHFFHLVLPALFPWLKDAFSVSYVELGILISTFFVVSGVVQFLAGFVVDRRGAFPVLCFGLVCLGLSALLMASATAYWMLAAGAALAGLGNGIFHPADFTLLNKKVSSPRLGHAFSTHSISGTLGWAAAPALLVPLAEFSDWRTALVVAGAIPLLTLALLAAHRSLLRDKVIKPSLAASELPRSTDSALSFMNSRAVWLCFGFFLLSSIALSAIQGFSVPALRLLSDLSLVTATTAFTAYTLAYASGTFAGGFIASSHGRHERVIALAMGVSALIALLIAGKVASGWGVPLMMAILGLGTGIAAPSRDLLIRSAAPKNATGRVYGMVYSGLDVGFAIAPLAVGWMMDQAMPAAVFVLVAVFQAAAILTSFGIVARVRQVPEGQAA